MNAVAILTQRDDGPRRYELHRLDLRLPAGRLLRRAASAFTGAAAMELGSVSSFEHACVVPDDPGEVVRGARPISPRDRERIREQHISRMMADYRRQESELLPCHACSA